MLRLIKRRRYDALYLYAKDVLVAIGKFPVHKQWIRYGKLSGDVIGQREYLLKTVFNLWKKLTNRSWQDIPVVYFMQSSVTSQHLPTIGIIVSTQDVMGNPAPFMLLRLASHPLAKKFLIGVPWIYREGITSMLALFKQSWINKQLGDFHQQMRALHSYNLSFKRKYSLETIVQQMRYFSFKHFWQTCGIGGSATQFIQKLTIKLKEFRLHPGYQLRLPLPNHLEVYPSLTFWLQLIECLFDSQMPPYWEIYWYNTNSIHPAALIFSPRLVLATEFIDFCTQDKLRKENVIDAWNLPSADVPLEPWVAEVLPHESVSMLHVLSSWGKRLQQY